MKKKTNNTPHPIVILTRLMQAIGFIGTICYLMSCNKPATGHTCKYNLCPYKGIEAADYPLKAEEGKGTPGYSLDSLHIIAPQLSYDEEAEILQY